MILRRVARPLLGSIFIFGGDDDPRLDPIVRIGAGVALALGVLPRASALVLAGSLVQAILTGQRYWEYSDPKERRAHEINLLKNLGLLGGLLLASADTKAKPSIRWRAKRVAGKVAERLP
jgi:putative oxidoreductase